MSTISPVIKVSPVISQLDEEHPIIQELANYGLRAQSLLTLVFVNKVLLEHSPAHLFIYCLWLLLCYHDRVE